MLPISRILAPVDFSPRCLGMMGWAGLLARRYDAEVVLLHVASSFYEIPPTGLSGPVLIPVSQKTLEEQARELETFASAELAGLRVRRLIYQGETTGQIVEFARAEQASMIVMPTHGHGILRRYLINSVTAGVLHDAACPVLTGVHVEEHAPLRAHAVSNILCALDLGPQSQEVLHWATRLAADFGAQLGIVHVMSALDPGVTLLLSPDFQLEMEKPIRARVETLQSAAGAEAAKIYIEEGEAPKTAAEVAKSMGAQLLVIGRGVREHEKARLRTNAYAIIRQSPCPVISI